MGFFGRAVKSTFGIKKLGGGKSSRRSPDSPASESGSVSGSVSAEHVRPETDHAPAAASDEVVHQTKARDEGKCSYDEDVEVVTDDSALANCLPIPAATHGRDDTGAGRASPSLLDDAQALSQTPPHSSTHVEPQRDAAAAATAAAAASEAETVSPARVEREASSSVSHPVISHQATTPTAVDLDGFVQRFIDGAPTPNPTHEPYVAQRATKPNPVISTDMNAPPSHGKVTRVLVTEISSITCFFFVLV